MKAADSISIENQKGYKFDIIRPTYAASLIRSYVHAGTQLIAQVKSNVLTPRETQGNTQKYNLNPSLNGKLNIVFILLAVSVTCGDISVFFLKLSLVLLRIKFKIITFYILKFLFLKLKVTLNI